MYYTNLTEEANYYAKSNTCTYIYLTYCSLVEFSICYLRSIRCNILGLFGSRQKLLLANSGDPDQMPHYVASDLGLHCLPMYPF